MVGMSSIHMSVEDMSSLSCCSWLSISHKLIIWSTMLDFRNHLKLIWVINDKFSGLTLVRTCSTRNDFALRCDCWNLVIVLLNRWQISLSSRKKSLSKSAIDFVHLLVSLTGWLGLIFVMHPTGVIYLLELIIDWDIILTSILVDVFILLQSRHRIILWKRRGGLVQDLVIIVCPTNFFWG